MRDLFEKIKRYLREVWSELGRVSWPQRKEIIASTAVVILCTFIVAFFLGIVDVILQKLLGYLIK
ncbi:MAG: preprotein translocase subunit SecE [candidate division NC10 bacterium]|nr:preprotein translocase subunit SecE [candidate division NC10 bacterium]